MSDAAPSRFEDLANELWLEIFDYLDWINLFLAFHGMNKRINQLLMSIKVLSLYSFYFTNHANSIYLFFQEFPMEEFKQIQHLQLTYDSSYEDALDIAKRLPSISPLISLTVNANCAGFEFNDEFAMIYLRQRCPFLQRLYLHGNLFERELQITDDASMFYFPSLRHIHVTRLHFISAIQLLDQCSQLRSFSARLYGDLMKESTTTSSFQLPAQIRSGLTAMRKLSLAEDDYFRDEFGSTFLEHLLPCCPNLSTFFFDFVCVQGNRRPLDPDWWTLVFISNKKLKHIALQLCIHGVLSALNEEVVQKFPIITLFAALKVHLIYTIQRIEFPRMAHIYSIEN